MRFILVQFKKPPIFQVYHLNYGLSAKGSGSLEGVVGRVG